MSEKPWRSVWDDPYDWCDDVSRLELKDEAGHVVVATGGTIDAHFDGEDEYPLLTGLRDPDGNVIYFTSFEYWRAA